MAKGCPKMYFDEPNSAHFESPRNTESGGPKLVLKVGKNSNF